VNSRAAMVALRIAAQTKKIDLICIVNEACSRLQWSECEINVAGVPDCRNVGWCKTSFDGLVTHTVVIIFIRPTRATDTRAGLHSDRRERSPDYSSKT
jgi:hypothetical protein